MARPAGGFEVPPGDALVSVDDVQERRFGDDGVIEIVAVGEESNNLEKVLIDIADGLEKRTSRQLELFVRLLEPVMLLVMAVITLIIVAGLLLPVFKMSSTIG